MKRLLGKLQNKRGSVLFLVVVIMSLLIIAASATFYVVSNQRNAVQVQYSSEQSYQSAVSICNTISDYIDGYGAKLEKKQLDGPNYENNILVKLVNLNAGTSFNATQDFSSLGLGDVNITVSKPYEPVVDENGLTIHTIDITTTATVNGESTTTTLRKAIYASEQVQTAEPFTRFLTSTGKGSDTRDVFLNAASIYGDTFFENEWTLMSAHLNCSLYSSRSFMDSGIKYYRPDNYKNWEMVIAENLTTVANGKYDSKLDNVFVGGNMSLNSQWNAERIYVSGDLEIIYNDDATHKNTFFVNKDCHIEASSLPGDTIYINGDLYIERNQWGRVSIPSGRFYVKGKIFYDGAEWALGEDESGVLYYTNEGGGKVSLPNFSKISASEIETAMINKIPQNNFVDDDPSKWEESDYFAITDWDSVSAYISNKASKNEYMVWDAESYFEKLEGDNKTAGTIVPGVNNTDTSNPSACLCTITKSCRLKRANFISQNGYKTNGNIYIKATTEPIFIYLQPEEGESFFQFGDNACYTNVIIEGKYPVVFILPEGIDFKMNGQSYIGHADLVMETGGIESVSELLKISNIFNAGGFSGGDAARQKVSNLFKEDSDGYLKFKTSGKTGTLHNNIFLVSKSDGNTMNFSAQATFAGYVYAPNCNLTSDTASQSVGFVGGIVVANYSYKNSMAHLVFTSPYDYHNNYSYDAESGEDKGDIANKIMSDSGGKKPGADKGKITVLDKVETIGFN